MYGVSIHSMNTRHQTSGSKTYFLWRNPATYMFWCNNYINSKKNFILYSNCNFGCILTITVILRIIIFSHHNNFNHMWKFLHISRNKLRMLTTACWIWSTVKADTWSISQQRYMLCNKVVLKFCVSNIFVWKMYNIKFEVWLQKSGQDWGISMNVCYLGRVTETSGNDCIYPNMRQLF
jgi:hypothetical protein